MAEREHFTNGRAWAFGTGFGMIALAFSAQVSGWSHWITLGVCYGIGIVLMLSATILIAKAYFSPNNSVVATQAAGIIPGIPTLSALLGQNSGVEFDAKKFFALAHYSPITAEVEKNIRLIAQQASPGDKEAFYARFIGIGVVAYQHDVSSLLIFGSQIRAMEEMNSRGIIPIVDLKKHYEKAVAEQPKTYEHYSFDEWLAFMKKRMLVAIYPSQMIELSWYGKDFLKYLAHIGKDTKALHN